MTEDKVTSIRGRTDPHSPVPLYFQVQELIRAELETGRWPTGSRIPSEHELCEMLDVSRTVVRQALAGLADERRLQRWRGRGTFVADPKIRAAQNQKIGVLHEETTERGLRPRTRVLAQTVVPADERVAEQLSIQASTPVVRIDRLRSVDRFPIARVSAYLPHDRVPGLESFDLTDRSLYQTLAREFDVRIARCRRTVEAVVANDRDVALLKVSTGAPMLFLRSIACLTSGEAIAYYEARHRGDRTVLEVELVREGGVGRHSAQRELG